VIIDTGSALERRTQNEWLRIEPWGEHSVRVRAAADAIASELDGALDSPAGTASVRITVNDDGTARLVNGRIAVEVDAAGRLRFLRSADSPAPDSNAPERELLAEKRPYALSPGPRIHSPRGDGTSRNPAGSSSAEHPVGSGEVLNQAPDSSQRRPDS
jgi:alpha-D-xyloside xylohydrolase